MFGATHDLTGDLDLGQFPLQEGDHLVDLGLSLPSLLGDLDGQFSIGLRVQVSKTQVLELLLDLGHTQAMSQRGINLEGFLGNEVAFGLGQRVQGSHVVEAVSQFDHDYTDILRHSQEHLPKALGLAILSGGKRELRQLGYPVHQVGDLVPESRPDLPHGGLGILDGIVEEACGDGAHVHFELRQDCRDLHGV